MSIELPLYCQEKPNTCALACLRMVLAAYGTTVEEREIEAEARLEQRGIAIDELVRLAHRFHLAAEIQEPTLEEVRHILEDDKCPIIFLDRAIFGLRPGQRSRLLLRNAKIHTVIPTRVTTAAVLFHDPLAPRIVRKSIRLFRLAYERLGSRCVVCWKRGLA